MIQSSASFSQPSFSKPAPACGFTLAAIALLVTALPMTALPVNAAPGSAGDTDEVRVHGSGDLRLEAQANGWHAIGRDGKAAALGLSATARIHQLERSGDSWLLSAVEQDAEQGTMRLYAGDLERGLRSLPTPVIEHPEMIAMPMLLSAPDNAETLDTLVWIEGESHRFSSIRAARWNGVAWNAPTTLSPRGVGTQTALDVARLADGSILATWAGYDGTDDEILWSRFDGDSWTKPQALTANRVPDVTPVLAADGDGALVAWSGFDGRDYRVFSARFRDSSWSTPSSMGGRGSVRPSFADFGEASERVLIFKQAEPDAWVISQMDDNGRMTRSVSMANSQQPRPVVTSIGQQGVKLLDIDAVRSGAAEKSSASETWTRWHDGATSE